jgi:hypothetical protein
MKSKPTGWKANLGVPPGRLFCVLEIIVLTATLTKPLLLAMHGINVWRRRRLTGAFEEAQTITPICTCGVIVM